MGAVYRHALYSVFVAKERMDCRCISNGEESFACDVDLRHQ